MIIKLWVLAAFVALIISPFSIAQRDPVLKQIEVPHAYYFREMYLPQLTTGPGALAWSPDSGSLVYSMAGSVWVQKIDSAVAEQLIAGPGYDYQPDWSPDGKWIVYCKYDRDSVSLWAYELASKKAHALTQDNAVNVEPRFSPDGKRIVFVSTAYHGRFHIFMGRFENGSLTGVERLTGENRSSLPRYYYSVFDHEISPVWSPDSSELLFVSNRGHVYGSGGFWRMKAEPGAEANEIHYEETTWKARPDFSPDGKRVVYGSYLGRAWHQLWVIPSQGGDAFPLTYGEFDNINPRWAPDGKQIAFISNRGGNTSLWIQDLPGGKQREVVAKERHFLLPVGTLHLNVTDEKGRVTRARIFVTGTDGRAYAPRDAWMQADDSFDRSERPFEAHYFESIGQATVEVPAGLVTVGIMKGFEYEFSQQQIDVKAGTTADIRIQLKQIVFPEEQDSRWVSGDVHVHMNYAGAYRNTPQHLVTQMAAENLSIVQDLVVNKEQRIPDMPYFRTMRDPASTAENVLLHGQEFHTSYWGHLGLLHLTSHFLIPGYSAYPNTAAASLFPSNASVADMAHTQRGVVGYVHPFDTYADPAKQILTDELPADVALGKVDYIEVLGFSDHKSTARVWYRLLNCGFRLPAAAGTDAMANFASLRGPVGLNRVYVKLPVGPVHAEPWLAGLKQGHTFATNGPLLGFSLANSGPGDELKFPAGGQLQIKFRAWMRSIVPVDHLEIICNGQPVREVKVSANRQNADEEGTVTLFATSWCLLRAYSDKAEYPVLDLYPYATTSPIYITIERSGLHAKEDAEYFIAWIDQLIAGAQNNHDWNNEGEKSTVLDQLTRARKVYEEMTR